MRRQNGFSDAMDDQDEAVRADGERTRLRGRRQRHRILGDRYRREKRRSKWRATGSAIRNHIEAGVYNDLTRADASAVFTEKGDEQQNKIEEFGQHCKLLQDRIAKARSFAFDPASQTMLDDEMKLSAQYLAAGEALIDAIVHSPALPPACSAHTWGCTRTFRARSRKPATNWQKVRRKPS